jgi:hypothetical protein
MASCCEAGNESPDCVVRVRVCGKLREQLRFKNDTALNG